MCKYDLTIDLKENNDPRTKMIEFIGSNKKVLEFGCATGFMSKILKERGCRVTGVEIDPGAAQKAKKYCYNIIISDIEQENFLDMLSHKSFDVIVLGDFLEHLRNPERLLLTIKSLLNKDGYLVASIPNIAHVSIRLQLLNGKFEYQELGLLDSSHLRFYTKDSIVTQMEKCGYSISQMDRVTKGIDLDDLKSFPETLQKSLIDWIEMDPDHQVYQYIIKAYPILDSNMFCSADVKDGKPSHHKVAHLKNALKKLILKIKSPKGEEKEITLSNPSERLSDTQEKLASTEDEDIEERLKKLGYM